jgi:hypothetical protein
MPRDSPPPTSAELDALQRLLDRSIRTAGASVADSIAFPGRQMTAGELVDFWRTTPLVAMATVGPHGVPHVAPVHAELRGPALRLVVYEDAVRRADLRTNPRVAFTTWRDGAAVICYGRARELPDSIADARPGRSGKPRRVVAVEVRLTRVYAMRAPARA